MYEPNKQGYCPSINLFYFYFLITQLNQDRKLYKLRNKKRMALKISDFY